MCENEMTHHSRAVVKCPAETPIGVGAYFIVLLCIINNEVCLA
jgi:hypothetical protein